MPVALVELTAGGAGNEWKDGVEHQPAVFVGDASLVQQLTEEPAALGHAPGEGMFDATAERVRFTLLEAEERGDIPKCEQAGADDRAARRAVSNGVHASGFEPANRRDVGGVGEGPVVARHEI